MRPIVLFFFAFVVVVVGEDEKISKQMKTTRSRRSIKTVAMFWLVFNVQKLFSYSEQTTSTWVRPSVGSHT